nr:hypothetical protein Iba_chr13cCG15130 [Ipomoea batatas]
MNGEATPSPSSALLRSLRTEEEPPLDSTAGVLPTLDGGEEAAKTLHHLERRSPPSPLLCSTHGREKGAAATAAIARRGDRRSRSRRRRELTWEGSKPAIVAWNHRADTAANNCSVLLLETKATALLLVSSPMEKQGGEEGKFVTVVGILHR